MDGSNQFALTLEDIQEVSAELQGKYSAEVIHLVHVGILLAPRLISLEIVPGPANVDFMDPDFRISSLHVLTTMRMVGLSKYGLMYFSLLENGGLKTWEDLCKIIRTFQRLYTKKEKKGEKLTSLWVAHFVELNCYDGEMKLFESAPLFSDTSYEEIEFCEDMMAEAFSVNMVTPNLGLGDVIKRLLRALDREKGDTTDEDDVAPEE